MVNGKNTEFQTLQKLFTILNGSPNSDFKIDSAIIPKFKYASIMSYQWKGKIIINGVFLHTKKNFVGGETFSFGETYWKWIDRVKCKIINN